MSENEYGLKALLELFEDRFHRLLDSSFNRRLSSEGKSVEISFDPENPFSPRFVGPRETDTLEFITLLRSFLPFDDKELVSLKRLLLLYRPSRLPAKIKQEFEELYGQFERFHNGSTPIILANGPISRKKLFCVFAYGDLIHMKDSQRAIYDRWKRDENFSALMESTFLNLLIYYLDYLGQFYSVNRKALSHLRSAGDRET